MPPAHQPRPRHRSRLQLGLLAMYSAMALTLLGSMGAGLALCGGHAGTVVTSGDVHQIAMGGG